MRHSLDRTAQTVFFGAAIWRKRICHPAKITNVFVTIKGIVCVYICVKLTKIK